MIQIAFSKTLVCEAVENDIFEGVSKVSRDVLF
jgi:hypothetical protein